MDNFASDSEVGALVDQISEMGRRVAPNPHHRVQLRNELMRRHYVLRQENVSPAPLWRRLFSLRRRSLLMVPALLATVVTAMLVSILPFSGQSQPQTVEAQIVNRLAQSAPYVTGVQWTLRRETRGKTSVVRLGLRFGASQRLYIYHHQPYLWQKDHWSLVPSSDTLDADNSFYWETAFASLPIRLSQNHAARLATQTVDGHIALGLQYITRAKNGLTITTTCWIDQATSLLVRLQRVTSHGRTVLQREVAHYQYSYEGAA